jgi:hypothetical protein
MRRYILGLFLLLPLALCHGREPGLLIEEAAFCLGRPVLKGYNRKAMGSVYEDATGSIQVLPDEESGLIQIAIIRAELKDKDVFLTPYYDHFDNSGWTYVTTGFAFYERRGVYAAIMPIGRRNDVDLAAIAFTRELATLRAWVWYAATFE